MCILRTHKVEEVHRNKLLLFVCTHDIKTNINAGLVTKFYFVIV